MPPPPPVWLFDLDNTLHNASTHIFPHINRSMGEYIEHHLGIDEHEATYIRRHYWMRYGATLRGLMHHHGTDPHHFLKETHHFPNLAEMLVFDKAVKGSLRRLPGRKILFSNGPRHYAKSILELTGLAHLFDAVYTLESVRFLPKPMLSGFRILLKAERLDPRRCILVEDSYPNLLSAKRLGMKTVLVSADSRRPLGIDLLVRSVIELPKRIGRL